MHNIKVGGQDVLDLVLLGDGDLRDALLSRNDGGRRLDAGLREVVSDRYGDRYQVRILNELAMPASALRSKLESRSLISGSPWFRAGGTDIIALSLHADLVRSNGWDNREAFRRDMEICVEIFKEHVGAHVIFLNACTIDRSLISNYHDLTLEPFSLRAHKLDLALMELSIGQGISIVDVDRLIAELGADEHVYGALDYAATACESIRDEFVRVIEDYGFFEKRPLVRQVGREEET